VFEGGIKAERKDAQRNMFLTCAGENEEGRIGRSYSDSLLGK
jgi:hypothetical protein